jgi:hypothetical protein
MSSEKLIHVKFEYPEAVESKKEILSFEMNLLETLQTLKNYNLLRKEEFALKLKLHRKIKSLLAEIKSLQKTLPKVELSDELHKEKATKTDNKKRPINDDINFQLQEIQRKLAALETNNF